MALANRCPKIRSCISWPVGSCLTSGLNYRRTPLPDCAKRCPCLRLKWAPGTTLPQKLPHTRSTKSAAAMAGETDTLMVRTRSNRSPSDLGRRVHAHTCPSKSQLICFYAQPDTKQCFPWLTPPHRDVGYGRRHPGAAAHAPGPSQGVPQSCVGLGVVRGFDGL